MSEPSDVEWDELRLWSKDVVVLFDWLMTVDIDTLPFTHPAQKQALWDLLTSIEVNSHAPYATAEDIRVAQERVARDMG